MGLRTIGTNTCSAIARMHLGLCCISARLEVDLRAASRTNVRPSGLRFVFSDSGNPIPKSGEMGDAGRRF